MLCDFLCEAFISGQAAVERRERRMAKDSTHWDDVAAAAAAAILIAILQ